MNIYWPVYTNLEKGVDELAFAIHIDDSQLGVYSSRITDLILRAAAEIESLSKELYKSNGGTKTGEFKFDDVAIKHLKNKWLLDQKTVIISSPHCFQSNRVLKPFVKNEPRTSSKNGRLTYPWNNAYQNLKHDRAQSLSFGNVKNLFDVMAALYLLNIYYRAEAISLEKDSIGVNFPATLGSTLFSVELAPSPSHDGNGNYIRPVRFDNATYFIDWTKDSGKTFQESVQAFEAHRVNLIFQHPKLIEYVSKNDISQYKGHNLAWDVLGQDEYIRTMQQAERAMPLKADQLKYEAVLNTNSV